METLSIELLNPKAINILNGLADLDLIKIRGELLDKNFKLYDSSDFILYKHPKHIPSANPPLKLDYSLWEQEWHRYLYSDSKFFKIYFNFDNKYNTGIYSISIGIKNKYKNYISCIFLSYFLK